MRQQKISNSQDFVYIKMKPSDIGLQEFSFSLDHSMGTEMMMSGEQGSQKQLFWKAFGVVKVHTDTSALGSWTSEPHFKISFLLASDFSFHLHGFFCNYNGLFHKLWSLRISSFKHKKFPHHVSSLSLLVIAFCSCFRWIEHFPV